MLGWLAIARGAFGELEKWQRLAVGSLILTSGIVGGAGGFLAAKATAHNTRDFDLAKKEYQNEQVKADLGYLNSKLNDEFEEGAAKSKPKSVRMLEA